MSSQVTLLFSSILFLIVFQMIGYAQSCDVKELAWRYKDVEEFSMRLGRFSVLHTMNICILTIIYNGIVITFFNVFSLSNILAYRFGTVASPTEFALILLLLLTMTTLMQLPVLEITDLHEIEDDYDNRSLSDEFYEKTSLDKHTRLCFAIFILTEIPVIFVQITSKYLGVESAIILFIIPGILSVSIVFFLFYLIDGYHVTLREEFLESSPKYKRIFP